MTEVPIREAGERLATAVETAGPIEMLEPKEPRMLEVRRGSGVMLPIRRIEMPPDAPSYLRDKGVKLRDGLPRELYELVQRRREALLEAVHRAVLRQLDRCALYERDLFPCRERLTGQYYLDPGESYALGRGGRIRAIVRARCLGWSDPWNAADRGRAVDYLGIDVACDFDPKTGEISAEEPFSIQVI